jgi:hypothetical protein
MNKKRQWFIGGGLIATMAMAVYMVVQLSAQSITGDYANAAIAEVRDAQNQVILRGQFAVVPEEDDDVERKAPLKAAGVDADAEGEAEVEYPKDKPAQQEVEFAIKNVEPGATYTFAIDGKDVGTAKANDKGEAEIELDVKPAAAARR